MVDLSKIPMPYRISRLPLDDRGYPVPWFVTWVDGKPDFRLVREGRPYQAIAENRCWICGQNRGSEVTFTIGPMCAVNRISSEPPAHRDCAVFAARACPFLSKPKAKRRKANMPDGTFSAPGIVIERNPGVALIWNSTGAVAEMDRDGGILFHVGEPRSVLWFAEGRPATRAEVLESINTGLPILRTAAEEDGPEAVAELERAAEAAMVWVPA